MPGGGGGRRRLQEARLARERVPGGGASGRQAAAGEDRNRLGKGRRPFLRLGRAPPSAGWLAGNQAEATARASGQ